MSFFVYVKIPLLTGQSERLPGLHEAIDAVLAERELGALMGWGSSLAGGSYGRGLGAASHHRLDIELSDQPLGLALLEETLARLAAPAGTELHYTEDGEALQKLYAGDRWAAPTPTTATHRRGPRR